MHPIFLNVSIIVFFPCWSFNGPEPGGPESKREKEADTPWFTRKANRGLSLGLALRHVGTKRPLELGEGTVRLLALGKKVSSACLCAPRN